MHTVTPFKLCPSPASAFHSSWRMERAVRIGGTRRGHVAKPGHMVMLSAF